MSSTADKIKDMPASIPTTFQLPGGPKWTTDFLFNAYLSNTRVSHNGRIFNLNHFVNHYCFHTRTPRSRELDPLAHFTVAQGKGSNITIRHHLEHTSNLKDLGYIDPVITYIKQKLTEVEEAVGPAARASIAIELFNYIRESGLEFTKGNQKFMAVVIAKCHQLRQEEHTRFPELEKACRLLLIDLGEVPQPLLTPGEIVIKGWRSLPCAFLCVTLQMCDGPVERGILHPDTGYVSTAFYGNEISLQHWFNKYIKEYKSPSKPKTFLNRLVYLRSGSVSFYDMLYNNTVKTNLVLATDEDVDKLVQERICRYAPDHCQCDLHRPLEPLCDCHCCKSTTDLWNEISELRRRLAILEKK